MSRAHLPAIRRRDLPAVLAGLLLLPASVWPQATAGLRRVAILQAASLDLRRHDAFRQGMQELGWEEGRNVEYLMATADGDNARLEALAASLVAQRPDVLINSSGASTRALQAATRSIPIVMVTVANPVGAGFVASLARPGGNITGLTNQQEEVLPKMLQVLHEMLPAAQRVAVLLSDHNPSYQALWDSARRACEQLRLTPLRVLAGSAAQLDAAVASAVAGRAQAVLVSADPTYTAAREKLHQLLHLARLPAAYGLRDHVAVGGLMSFGVNFVASWRYAAKYVNAILRGTKPADLPVEQPTKFELVINLSSARSLGLVVPKTLLLRADEVIE